MALWTSIFSENLKIQTNKKAKSETLTITISISFNLIAKSIIHTTIS
jgi:hypothetical protein